MVGFQGEYKTRTVYKYVYGNKTFYVAVTIGSNGYIVGANPTTEDKIVRN